MIELPQLKPLARTPVSRRVAAARVVIERARRSGNGVATKRDSGKGLAQGATGNAGAA